MAVSGGPRGHRPDPVQDSGPSVAVRAGRAARRGLGRPHPARIVAMAFAAAVALSTALLMVPIARAGKGQGTSFADALFTATSSVSVTGLSVVDTSRHWSVFGQGVILVSVQVGGFGIMTLASLLGVLVSRRLGLRSRLLAYSETPGLQLGDVRRIVLGVATMSLVVEAVTALILTLRFWLGYETGLVTALGRATFLAVMGFNNAGMTLTTDNLVPYVTDPWVCLPMSVSIILGGLGFPVLLELWREQRPRRWSLHTKLTLSTYGLLLVAGAAMITALEWGNPRTLGPLSFGGKLLAGFFHGVQPRSAGFNSVDYGAMDPATWLVTDALMFIGGGSASTAGGIKVTTFVVLFFAIVAEARGDRAVDVFHRSIPTASVRLAVSVALLGVAIVFTGTFLVMLTSDIGLDKALFESMSAFSTTGLSTGATAEMPDAARYVLIAMMFVGRIGTVTAASALALRERNRLFSFPEERPGIG
jgi:potassium uptake TrkH family protein